MDKFENRYVNADKEKAEQKIVYTTPLEDSIKSKLYQIASKGYGVSKPNVITIDLIKEAIEVYKNENHIFYEVNMTNCKEIALSFKRIIKIAYLENLVKLEKLKLDNNIIMKIENLDKLKNLKWLDLSFNNISKIEGLRSLINLTDLSLFNNEIEEVNNLDFNTKLNILSVGNNKIKDVKKMVDYLKTFPNLQGLTVSGNVFNKDAESGGVNNTTQIPSFPLCYETILVGLEKLKYLDYRPVDPDERDRIIQNSHKNELLKERENMGKGEQDKERSLEKDVFLLTKANSEHIISFWSNFDEKLKSEKIVENFHQLPDLMQRLTVLYADVKKPLFSYRDDILIKQEEKDKIIKTNLDLIEANLEEMVEKSKGEIHSFKKRFREFIKTKPENLGEDNVEENIKLRELKEKLYEIELFNKNETDKKITELKNSVDSIVDKMKEDTKIMRDQLDSLRGKLKEDLLEIVKKKFSNQNEEENKEDISEEDFYGDIERVGEYYMEHIENMKDVIDQSRDTEKETFINELKNKEYYRNRQRIEDINDVYKFWNNKVVSEIKKLLEEKKTSSYKYY